MTFYYPYIAVVYASILALAFLAFEACKHYGLGRYKQSSDKNP
tara:strand:- start:86 stop:214 length:129 start_codon:yes stop_codon:yes gene_type:complete